ncbi:MAG: hypothetical protein DRJ26_00645 [Candidatus Methanomethylicota archaeon]|uniref:Double-stranded DNA-binding protein n=1 Tax=Thermoproteota archaeon TaxID=2056631 RepID=A0A497EXL4_9CREN|nr:MAG: hypothetical protein DRJ20_01090 [Candidatus Verstraetearchaeota archaeon]RLE55569.1 MAG: hypothetical protein DRJ26_00645 [Candidatus Verstraetearchaeota archaeon]
MADEDLELELLKLRKLARLQRLMTSKKSQPKQKDPMEILSKMLVGRARDVLKAAEAQYPLATRKVVEALAKFIEEGKIKEPINGYALYKLFLDLGMPVRMPIRIYYEKKGERKPLSELFKED